MNKWYAYDGPHGNELQWYTGTRNTTNPNVVVSDGTLKLIAREGPVPDYQMYPFNQPGERDGNYYYNGDWGWPVSDLAYPFIDAPNHYQYTSGWVETKPLFKYGYFEIRCKIPIEAFDVPVQGNDLWPAFWLYVHNPRNEDVQDEGYEIDIFEFVGDDNEFPTYTMNFHYFNDDLTCPTDGYDLDHNPATGCGDTWICSPYGRCSAVNQSQACCDVSIVRPRNADSIEYFDPNEWNTFALEWNTKELVYYINNIPIRKTFNRCGIPESFMTLILNLAIVNDNDDTDGDENTHWDEGIDLPNANGHFTDFPATYEIDYVRVYKKIEVGNFGTSESAGGWNNKWHRRITEDVNNDGYSDLVCFGESQVFLSLSENTMVSPSIDALNGHKFEGKGAMISDFCRAQGWDPFQHPIYLVDVNGDNLKDIVGFGGAGIFVSLLIPPSWGNPYWLYYPDPPALVLNHYGTDAAAGGYSNPCHPRYLGDVNGDGITDVIAFAGAGLQVAYGWRTSTTNFGFNPGITELPGEFGVDCLGSPLACGNSISISGGCYDPNRHRRMVADINGDGRADVIGFHENTIRIALAKTTGNGFNSPTNWQTNGDFTYSEGWLESQHPIYLKDISGDGYLDIVGFWTDGVYLAIADPATQTFGKKSLLLPFFGTQDVNLPENLPKYVEDMNGDGYYDLVAFAKDGIQIAFRIEEARGIFFDNPKLKYNFMGSDPGAGDFHKLTDPRWIADLNGDNAMDAVAFGPEGVFTYISPFSRCLGTNGNKTNYNPNSQTHYDFINNLEAFPNPFNESVSLKFTFSHTETAVLEIFDMQGKKVTTLFDGIAEIGTEYQFNFDASSLPGGIYLCRLQTQSGKTFTEKLILQK